LADPGILVGLRVTAFDRSVLRLLAQHGGEIAFSWSMLQRPEATVQLRALVDDKRLVSEIHRDDRLFLRMTDQGRSALAQIDEQERRARIIA
jgi:hypothetical protein